MYSVLSQEEPVSVETIEVFSFPVNVEVEVGDDDAVSFVPVSAVNYTIEAETIRLKGSGGSPREFQVTFTLITPGYVLMNPALKFFQGGSTKAGFRVSPDPVTELSAQIVLFNTLGAGDKAVQDSFSVLVRHSTTDRVIIHDPTIIWDPPHG